MRRSAPWKGASGRFRRSDITCFRPRPSRSTAILGGGKATGLPLPPAAGAAPPSMSASFFFFFFFFGSPAAAGSAAAAASSRSRLRAFLGLVAFLGAATSVGAAAAAVADPSVACAAEGISTGCARLCSMNSSSSTELPGSGGVGGSPPKPGGPSSMAGGASGSGAGRWDGSGAGESRRLSRYWSFLLTLAFMADAPGTIFSMSLAAAPPAPPLRRPGPGVACSGVFLWPWSGRAR
uniref:Uncharacterized protein n=1 Tax=Arundo donax TaxID=35708 RepID=A0A0A8Z143_ARUDO